MSLNITLTAQATIVANPQQQLSLLLSLAIVFFSCLSFIVIFFLNNYVQRDLL